MDISPSTSEPTSMAPLHSTATLPPKPFVDEPSPQLPAKKKTSAGSWLVRILVVGKIGLLALSKIKFLTTGLTMFVSMAAYALFWGWSFAAGFVILILVHEMGHVIQLRREGVQASAPMFIPFLGAVVSAKSLGEDAAAEARVGLAGPVLGTLGTLVPAAIFFAGGGDFWGALAYVGFFINLFNLMPVVPFDGGRAAAAMHPALWLVGFIGMLSFAVFFHSIIIGLFAFLGGADAWSRWKRRKHALQADPSSKEYQETVAYYQVSKRAKLLVAATYLGLVAVCAIGMELCHVPHP